MLLESINQPFFAESVAGVNYCSISFQSDPSFLIAHYCGSMQSWTYEGMVVLTRTEKIDKELETRISDAVQDLDLNFSDFCRPRTENCTNAEMRMELWK